MALAEIEGGTTPPATIRRQLDEQIAVKQSVKSALLVARFDSRKGNAWRGGGIGIQKSQLESMLALVIEVSSQRELSRSEEFLTVILKEALDRLNNGW